jgi:hypothetical protein
MEIFKDDPPSLVTTNIPFLVFSSFIIFALTILLCIYRLRLS